jgi:hypothetical protein
VSEFSDRLLRCFFLNSSTGFGKAGGVGKEDGFFFVGWTGGKVRSAATASESWSPSKQAGASQNSSKNSSFKTFAGLKE